MKQWCKRAWPRILGGGRNPPANWHSSTRWLWLKVSQPEESGLLVSLARRAVRPHPVKGTSEAGTQLDPNCIAHELEAWMPEQVAAHKLRGFVHDVGGRLIECVPGKIRVRLGGKGSIYAPDGSSLARLLRGRTFGQFDMELRLKRGDSGRGSRLRISMLLSPLYNSSVRPQVARAVQSRVLRPPRVPHRLQRVQA